MRKVWSMNERGGGINRTDCCSSLSLAGQPKNRMDGGRIQLYNSHFLYDNQKHTLLSVRGREACDWIADLSSVGRLGYLSHSRTTRCPPLWLSAMVLYHYRMHIKMTLHNVNIYSSVLQVEFYILVDGKKKPLSISECQCRKTMILLVGNCFPNCTIRTWTSKTFVHF